MTRSIFEPGATTVASRPGGGRIRPAGGVGALLHLGPNPLFALSSLIGLSLLVAFSLPAVANGFSRELPATQLAALLGAPDALVLDVRMAEDCGADIALKQRHMKIAFDSTQADVDANRMTEDEFIARVLANRSLAAARAAKRIVLVLCCFGGRAEAAAKLLAKHGFQTAYVPGGLMAEAVPRRLLRD